MSVCTKLYFLESLTRFQETFSCRMFTHAVPLCLATIAHTQYMVSLRHSAGSLRCGCAWTRIGLANEASNEESRTGSNGEGFFNLAVVGVAVCPFSVSQPEFSKHQTAVHSRRP